MSSKQGAANQPKKKLTKKKKFVPHAVKVKQDKKSASQSRIEEQLKESNEQLEANQMFKQLISASAQTQNQKRDRRLSNSYKFQMNELNNNNNSNYPEQNGAAIQEKKYEEVDEMDVDEQTQTQQEQCIMSGCDGQFQTKRSLLDYLQQYPTMLPLRQPLEEAAAVGLEDLGKNFIPKDLHQHTEYDKTCADIQGDQLQIWQFPQQLPFIQSNCAVGIQNINGPTKIGKLLSYESGKKKLVLNDVVFDVDNGTSVGTHANVALLDLQNKSMCHLGEISQRMVCSPDVVALLQQTATDT